MQTRAFLILWTVVLVVAGTAPAAVAKKAPAPACAGQFAVAQSGIPGVPSSVLRLVSIDARGVTISTDCGTSVSRPRRTRSGWKFQAHWRPCDGARRVVLHGKVDRACTTLNGVLRTRKPNRRVKLGMRIAAPCGQATAFASTFAASRRSSSSKHGCTEQVCHGSAANRAASTCRPTSPTRTCFEVPSTASTLERVEPGDKRRSFLWLKLAAATDPRFRARRDPRGADAERAAAAQRRRARAGAALDLRRRARRPARCAGTEHAARRLPAAGRADHHRAARPPPAPGEGVQFVMPPWQLPANSEHEICFATYYDITDQVPEEFQDPSGQFFRFARHRAASGSAEPSPDPELRYHRRRPASTIPSFGAWTCKRRRARRASVRADRPRRRAAAGLCASALKQSFACIGYGPRERGDRVGFADRRRAAGAGVTSSYADGVFAQIPMKGILYWNSHAFNLTDEDTTMHARLNYYFADGPALPGRSRSSTPRTIFSRQRRRSPTQTICNDHVLPQGARLFQLTSHTHKRGKHFTVDAAGRHADLRELRLQRSGRAALRSAAGVRLAGPGGAHAALLLAVQQRRERRRLARPDDGDARLARAAERQCAAFRPCTPVACVAGKVGAACNGVDDDATCDSSPGAGDGECDACPITGGESTENEMFILIGNYYIDPVAAARAHQGQPAGPALDVGMR